ncbi:unnamed protein product [Nezara viridula]|uniref:Uncharacterized protein n=1 Tax=Nezara viridula TaxID=85310 RepID=A0A9P0HNE1_NEZVI|nr:unnamed protein product [Nezara viridula]
MCCVPRAVAPFLIVLQRLTRREEGEGERSGGGEGRRLMLDVSGRGQASHWPLPWRRPDYGRRSRTNKSPACLSSPFSSPLTPPYPPFLFHP